MKKIYIICLFLCLTFLIPSAKSPSAIAKAYASGEYYFYSSQKEEKGNFYSLQRNGEQSILNCPIFEAEERKEEISGEILGESFTVIAGRKEALRLIDRLGAKTVSEGEVGGIYTYYLYSGSVKSKSVELGGEKVNMQIALSNGKMHVGFPLILGSY